MTQSAIIIVESKKAAIPIVRVINANASIFAQNPVRMLRADDPSSRELIMQFARKFNIRATPALITADNKVRVGNTAICAFLPQFARSLHMLANSRAAPRVPRDESDLETYQREMVFDGAQLPSCPSDCAPCGAPVGRRGHEDDDDEDPEQRKSRIEAEKQRRLAQMQSHYSRGQHSGSAAPADDDSDAGSVPPRAPIDRAQHAAQSAMPMRQAACAQQRQPKTHEEFEDAWEREIADAAH